MLGVLAVEPQRERDQTIIDEEPVRHGVWLPLVVYAAVLVALVVVSWQTVVHFEEHQVSPRTFAGSWLLDGWFRWDAGWYLQIAEEGYRYVPGVQSSVAYFPAYAILMRWVGDLIGDPPLAGILLSMACGALALTLFWQWCRARMTPPAAVTALVLIAVYPYSWYLYGAVYSDALFLATVLGAFLLVERDHVVLAGLAGALGTATRPVGVAVVIGLVIRVMERRGAFSGRWRLGLPARLDLRRLRATDAAVLLSGAGLLGYMGYLWYRFDDPFLFSSVQEAWGQPATPRTWVKYTFVAILFRSPNRGLAFTLLAHAIVTLLFVLAVPFVVRRFGYGYGALVAVLVFIPLVGSKDFQGLGRYMLSAFPVIALAGEWLSERPTIRTGVLAGSAVLLVLGTAGFAHGYYLA